MKDIFVHNSVRPNGQLLASSAAVPNGHTAHERTDDDGKLEQENDANGMVHFLRVQSKKLCLMVDSHWTLAGEGHEFQQKQAYEDAAQKAGFVTRILKCPDQKGTRHMLFLGKTATLKDADYLECLPSSLQHLI